MSQIDPHRRRFAPLPADADRPLWSVMIPTYNCAHYLRETLASVLCQDPGSAEMQIEVVDDASGDDPGSVVREFASGRVSFFRQQSNVGTVQNLNTCVERSRGELVHILHGDDAIRDGFYRAMVPHFTERSEVGAAFCRYISIDGEGNWQTIAPVEPDGRGVLVDWLTRIAAGQRLQTPCMVVRRSVYESLGGFDVRLTHCEDWEMWTRIASAFPVSYEPDPLALYRVHERSASRRSRSVGADVVDVRRAIAINRRLLGTRADEITARALEIAATTAVRRAVRMLNAGDSEGARAQVREALRTRRSPAVLESLAFFAAVSARRSLGRLRRRT